MIIVVVILGIMATLGFIQYAKTVERAKTAEARSMLSTIRTAQHGYREQFGSYTSDINDLPLVVVASDCPVVNAFFYFSYSIDASVATATRCTGSTGKSPGYNSAYTITLDYNTGTLSGSNAAFY